MTILDSQAVLPEFIKLRWEEPYVSAGLNRKTFRSLPRGVYSGFVVVPGPGVKQVQVVHNDPRGWQQDQTSGFSAGAFDTASGWSVAVHESAQGFNTTLAIQYRPGLNFVFSLAGLANSTVFAVIDAQYRTGFATAAQVKLVQADELEADPTLLVLARIDVPISESITEANITYDDPAYPRVLPFASDRKYGFMSRQHVQRLEFLESVSASPAFSTEIIIETDGPQDIDLPPGSNYVVGSDDLWVFKNGRKQTHGAARDYLEIDRGDGRGEKITWVGLNLREGDRIELRIQRYSAVATSTTGVLDEGALIDSNVIQMNFVGPGVAVLPDGPRRVRVVVPGGGGGGGAVKTKVNSMVSSMAAFRAVHLVRGLNTVVYCDPRQPDHKFYGITLQNVAASGSVDVQVAGILQATSGFISDGEIGDDVFVAHDGLGTLTAIPPDATSGHIFRVGMLDGANNAVSGAAVDLVFDRGRLA